MRSEKYYERLEKKRDRLNKQRDKEFQDIMKKYGEEMEGGGTLIDFGKLDKEDIQGLNDDYQGYFEKWHGDNKKF